MLFVKTETFMQIGRIAAVILMTLLFLSEAAGSPVRNSHATYVQPNGRTFTAKIRGDEWLKIRTTENGCAIVKDSEGWWCYAVYDSEGRIESTGYRVGDKVPSETILASRNIPYDALSKKSAERRLPVQQNLTGLLESTRRNVAATKGGEETVQMKAIAILVEFSDVKFQHTKEDFEKLLNEPGYKGTGSAKDYFEDQFGQGWEFSFDVSEIITLDWPVKHYGENTADGDDIRPWDMVEEACRAADRTTDINWELYDQDGDNSVDNVYVFYAGKSESENTDEPELIWPHQYYIFSGEGINLTLDGKRIDRYACSAEISDTRSLTGIGSFCHEYAHTLGLVDLYDTDYDRAGGWAAGVWKTTSLMDGGNYNNNSATPPNFNCIEREMLGLCEPGLIEEGNTYRLSPVHEDGTCFRLESGTEGEYYLFECRSNEGWDEYIGGKGMLVYHIDRNATETINGIDYSRWQVNSVNAVQEFQCADLIEADGRSDLITGQEDFYRSIRGIFFPQENVTSIRHEGTPSLTFRYGKSPDISIAGIKKDADDIIFSAVHNSSLSDLPVVTDASFTAFPDAAIIRFSKSDPEIEGTPYVEWRRSGSDDEFSQADPVEYEKGSYACKLENLESGNVSYEVMMRFEYEGSNGSTRKLSFMTKRVPAVSWPYIYMTDSVFKAGKGIALHVVNAEGEVTWEYDGRELDPAKDYHFYPQTDGILKAIVTRDDGSHDIIIKEIELTE